MNRLGGRYYVTFGIGMIETIDALSDTDCDRMIGEMVNSRNTLSTLAPNRENIITDPGGADRIARVGDFLQR